MKSIIKSANKFLLLTAIAGSLLLISSTVAAATAGIGGKNFCTNFSALSEKYKQNIDTQIGRLQERIDTEAERIQTNRQTFDNNLEKNRTKWEKNRKDVYDKLSKKAVTDVQKQALTTFKAAIDAAATARENAIDIARTAYRKGVDQLVSQRKIEILQNLTGFKTKIGSTIQQAVSNCSAGTASSTDIRQIYQKELQAAKEVRNTGMQEIDKIGPKVKELAQARNTAIQQAMKDYQSALQTAITNLKAVFGQTIPNSTSSPATP